MTKYFPRELPSHSTTFSPSLSPIQERSTFGVGTLEKKKFHILHRTTTNIINCIGRLGLLEQCSNDVEWEESRLTVE